MISGPLPPNILRCLPPEVQVEELAAQRQAERRFIAKSEKVEQRRFTKWLKEERATGRLYFINPRSDKASTIEVGHPDYTIWLKDYPVTVFIEMKAAAGEISSEQEQVHVELQRLGNHVHVYVAWNSLQAKNIVQFYLSQALTQGQNDNRTVAGQAASQEGTQRVATKRDVQAAIGCGTPADDVARTLRSHSANGNLP